jgi:hypothetical protein
MQPTTLWIAGAVLWMIICAAAAGVIYVRRKDAGLLREDGLLLGGIAFLAATPLIPLIRSAFGESPSPANGAVPFALATVFLAASLSARRRRLNPKDSASTLTFREKSACLTALATMFVYVGYFYMTWNATMAAAVPVFIGSVVLIVIIMIVGHVVIAGFHSPLDELDETPDERDREAALYAVRNAYYLLAVGIWLVPILAIMSFRTMVVVNTALAVFILSELTRLGSLIVFYRIGSR